MESFQIPRFGLNDINVKWYSESVQCTFYLLYLNGHLAIDIQCNLSISERIPAITISVQCE